MNLKSISNLFLPFCFLMSTAQPLYSQNLTASIDQVIHLSGVSEMEVSHDNRFYATTDEDGVVVVNDIETGKAIANHTFGGNVIDVFFTQEFGKLLCIYKNRQEHLLIDIFNFSTNETRTLANFESEFIGLVPELDFNEIDHLITISTDEHFALIYNYEKNNFERLDFELSHLVVGYEKDGTCQFINSNEEGDNIKVYNYNHKNKSLKHNRNINISPYYLEKDLNNRNMFRRDGQLECNDSKLGISFTLAEDGFYFEDNRLVPDNSGLKEISIHDFAFSPDGKYLCLVGGHETIVEDDNGRNLPLSARETGRGYVALFDVTSKKMIWRTEGKKRQTKFDTFDLGWLDNETVVTCDEKGNTIIYHVSQNEYIQSFDLPVNNSVACDITGNFSKIYFSLYEDPTFAFSYAKYDDPIEKVFQRNSFHMDASKNKANAVPQIFSKEFSYENILGKLSSKLTPSIIAMSKITSITVSSLENYEAYTFEIERSNIVNKQIIFDDFIFDNTSTKLGVFIKGIPFYIDDIALMNNTESSVIDLSQYNCAFISQIGKTEKGFFIVKKDLNNVSFSKNGKYLNYNNTVDNLYDSKNTNAYHVLASEPITEDGFSLEVPNTFNFFTFDENSNLAFGITSKNEMIVWDTETNDIIQRKNVSRLIQELELTYQGINLITHLKIDSLTHSVFMNIAGANLVNYNYVTDEIRPIQKWEETASEIMLNFELSQNGKYIEINTYNSETGFLFLNILNVETLKTIYSMPLQHDKSIYDGKTSLVYFHEDKPLALLHDLYANFKLIDLENPDTILLATLKFFPDGNWLVFTPDGIFDGSKEGRRALFYLSGTNVILYDQLKETFWEPGLFNKLVTNPKLIQNKSLNKTIDLHPSSTIELTNKKGEVTINLIEQNGGIGQVSLFINNKEVLSDINKTRSSKIKINLKDYRDNLYTAGKNKIGIVTYNKEGWLSSRPNEIYIEANLDGDKGEGRNNDEFSTSSRGGGKKTLKKPGLFGLFVGTSDYRNTSLNLVYADKDAQVLTDAFHLIGEEMYDSTRTNLSFLYSKATTPDSLPTKENISKSFEFIAENARPEDIIILFFSGHGLTIGEDFYYLTGLAGNIDLNLSETKRNETCVSSNEIKEALRKIKSSKQILILDACHSGRIAEILEDKPKALSTSQQKALESLEDKMGVYILASSEANQKSFETSYLQQGLLTFSLLRGMSGGAIDENKTINVIDLLTYASNESENIAKNRLGKSQRPVLGIGHGGSSFPIGFQNDSLKVQNPQNKHLIGPSNFVMLPLINDPENLNEAIHSSLRERGALGRNESFIYLNNFNDSKTIGLTGSYTVEGDKIKIKFYMLKEQEKYKGPFELEYNKDDKQAIADKIIKLATNELTPK